MRPSSKQLLKSAGTNAMLISNLTNIRYLSGMSVSSGLLLVTKKSFILFVDSRYSEAAVKLVRKGVIVKSPSLLKEFLKKEKDCGIEEDQVTLGTLRRWKTLFPSTKFVRTSGIVEEFRRSKDESELKRMRRAHRITVEILRRIPSALRVGISEKEVAGKIEQWARELGADGMSFPSIVGFGPHTSIPHHSPTTRKLRKGQIVQIDIGASYDGYCSDRSAVYFTAKIKPEYKRILMALTHAKDSVIERVKAGVSTKELDLLARSILKKYDVEEYFTHSLGHGVGLEIHEGVTLSSKQGDRKLLKGEVITVEPGVYFPGKFGMRLEEMVVVS